MKIQNKPSLKALLHAAIFLARCKTLADVIVKILVTKTLSAWSIFFFIVVVKSVE